jgi:hypothetical protein
MDDLITSATLKELVKANMVRSAFVFGELGGFSIVVKYGMTERVLAARTKDNCIHKRTFSSLDAADTFLRKTIHLPTYTVNSANYEPAPLSSRAVKAKDRLQKIHSVAAHTTWLRQEIEASRADPQPAISHAEASAQFGVNLERFEEVTHKKSKHQWRAYALRRISFAVDRVILALSKEGFCTQKEVIRFKFWWSKE